MQQFTAIEYVQINIANAFGKDKMLWEHRILWTATRSIEELWDLVDEADDKELYIAAVYMLEDALAAKPSGGLIGLDATWSGLQIMGALIGCETTCLNVNVLDAGRRVDGYTDVNTILRKRTGIQYKRAETKDAAMPHYYGSVGEPQNLFGEDTPELEAFYKTLNGLYPGAEELRADLLSIIEDDALCYTWKLPDGHVAKCKVMSMQQATITVGEVSFLYRAEVNAPNERDVSLLANVIHSIDGYIVREMIRRAHALGFACFCVHDSFWCHPKYVGLMRQNYNNILADIHEANIMQDIMRELTGDQGLVFKQKSSFGVRIRKANYALS
ncbi:MAG: hypothetical protein HRU18_02675 [Pseudoalteromonas sp.]|uniref:DNA-directed RNA polymerase n=1 Tax=Pseudoalteromonas sp. TaxID=53249 RepID=UPI001D425B7F|nr:DNA-directed RNA polymerase [Pseudoalteromonas sp.]NRA77088.1 hypothetical protein [Pseudoalteromonas sp.]